MDERWEFCTFCGDGFTNYIGMTKDKKAHEYECTSPECEAYFKVPVGQGQYDIRLGMELSRDVLYWQKCDKCRREKPCRVTPNLRFGCLEHYSDII